MPDFFDLRHELPARDSEEFLEDGSMREEHFFQVSWLVNLVSSASDVAPICLGFEVELLEIHI